MAKRLNIAIIGCGGISRESWIESHRGDTEIAEGRPGTGKVRLGSTRRLRLREIECL